MLKNKDIVFNRFRYLLKKSDKIAILCHKKPDGDAIGSMMALFDSLKNDATAQMFCIDPAPQSLEFLLGTEKISPLSKIVEYNADLVIAVDCGDFSQTALERKQMQNAICVNIDHHGNEFFGDLNIVDTKASSASEIIYSLLLYLGKPLTRQVATCIFAGIVGDTDNFKNPNTSKDVLDITSSLMIRGIDTKTVMKNLNYNKSSDGLKMWGKVLSRVKKHDRLNMVSTYITHDEISENQACKEEINGIANFLNSIPDVKAACLLVEHEKGEIKGSLRTMSDQVDVSKIAQLFGGGGHPKAAGFVVKGSIENNNGHISIARTV